MEQENIPYILTLLYSLMIYIVLMHLLFLPCYIQLITTVDSWEDGYYHSYFINRTISYFSVVK